MKFAKFHWIAEDHNREGIQEVRKMGSFCYFRVIIIIIMAVTVTVLSLVTFSSEPPQWQLCQTKIVHQRIVFNKKEGLGFSYYAKMNILDLPLSLYIRCFGVVAPFPLFS